MNKGTLYLCGTPIGNLEDMTFRAVRVLNEVDLIAAEDTRHTVKLLNHFEIKTPLISYHEHNKGFRGEKLIDELLNGKNIALVTDAGMPCISDPGSDLVRLCHEYGVCVTVVPSASAFVAGLALSGISSKRFVFAGFLSGGKKDRLNELKTFVDDESTAIFYEAPHHLKRTIEDMYTVFGDRQICLAREITKRFEEVLWFKLSEALEFFQNNEPKGEYVIIVEGATDVKERKAAKWEEISVQEHMEIYLEKGLSKMDAMKAVAKDRGVRKADIYSVVGK